MSKNKMSTCPYKKFQSFFRTHRGHCIIHEGLKTLKQSINPFIHFQDWKNVRGKIGDGALNSQ